MSELKDSSERIGHPQVSCSLSYKINMGNYESLGIDMGVTDYAQPGESVSKAHERVFNFVHRRLTDKVAAVRKELEGQESQGGY